MNSHDHKHDHAHPTAKPVHACCAGDATPAATTVTDPVCGMQVDPATSKHHAQHAGDEYHFCSARCRERFIADPQKFLTPSEPDPAMTGATYVGPMHPEVSQVGPGTCPICGMALEPDMPQIGQVPGPT